MRVSGLIGDNYQTAGEEYNRRLGMLELAGC